MTFTQLALISAGIIMNVFTFALGVSAGISITRKEPKDVDKNPSAAWHKYHK